MFTGIIEAIGTIRALTPKGGDVRVLVETGQTVEAGQALVVLEAMKMEHSIRSAQAGVVKSLFCSEGEMVSEGAVLLEMEEA